MGRVRQAFIKRAGNELIEKYGDKFTTDFDTNKKIVEEVALISTKRLRNRIAGYITSKIKMLVMSLVMFTIMVNLVQ
ncbi:MAG TPA: 30S ribosomal protein S17e [Methanococcaceae archaeon]|nr:30S ribosomal protein S17e [Methanococcaceae archaeon]